jgi:hypothetical protein
MVRDAVCSKRASDRLDPHCGLAFAAHMGAMPKHVNRSDRFGSDQ